MGDRFAKDLAAVYGCSCVRGCVRKPRNWGAAVPLSVGELGPHLTQCGLGRGLPTYQVASWSIQPFGQGTPTLQTGQTGQRSDSIGRTVLQTVAQKRNRKPVLDSPKPEIRF